MWKRMLLMIVTVILFLGVIGFVKFRQVQAAIAQYSSFQPPPEAVTTVVAAQQDWEQVVSAIGSVTPVNGVTVSADLAGVVRSIEFESGRPVKAGDVLVRLDVRQEQAQLASAQAQLNLAQLNYERAKGLKSGGVLSQADYDTAKAELDKGEASVREMQAIIDRKTITAPFSGVLGIRQIHLGQYLAEGTAVVPLQSLDPIHVDFGVPQQSLGSIKVGGAIRVTTDGLAGMAFEGKITAIDSVVDSATRNAQVQATLANPGHQLHPGMFVKADTILPATTQVIAVPTSSIRYAPYGDSVFVVEQVKGPKGNEYLGVRQQVVKLGEARGDQVAVLSGLKPGEQIVTSGVFKLRNGAAVLVNNEVQPGNNPSPKPEES
jgi:membrane fusion protein (multidrug efflux system)